MPPSTACRQTISGSISLPSPGYFSPFPHGTVRYRSRGVLSLGEWAPQLPTGFFVPGRTYALPHAPCSCSTRLSRSMVAGSTRLRVTEAKSSCVVDHPQRRLRTTPIPQRGGAWHDIGLGSSRFVRHYYGNTVCSSGYVRCFSWPGALPRTSVGAYPEGMRVAPLGNRRITACKRLPSAYRRSATSVFGTSRPGIRRLPLLSCRSYCLCSSIFSLISAHTSFYVVRYAIIKVQIETEAVERGGLEPPTSCVQSRRSPN